MNAKTTLACIAAAALLAAAPASADPTCQDLLDASVLVDSAYANVAAPTTAQQVPAYYGPAMAQMSAAHVLLTGVTPEQATDPSPRALWYAYALTSYYTWWGYSFGLSLKSNILNILLSEQGELELEQALGGC